MSAASRQAHCQYLPNSAIHQPKLTDNPFSVIFHRRAGISPKTIRGCVPCGMKHAQNLKTPIVRPWLHLTLIESFGNVRYYRHCDLTLSCPTHPPPTPRLRLKLSIYSQVLLFVHRQNRNLSLFIAVSMSKYIETHISTHNYALSGESASTIESSGGGEVKFRVWNYPNTRDRDLLKSFNWRYTR